MENKLDFTIEELSMNAWPAISTVLYDGWVARLSGGYANRGNSISPIYPSRLRLEEKLDFCDRLYARHGLPANYKLTNGEEHKHIDEMLDKLKYKKIHETSIQVCQLREPPGRIADGIAIADDFSGPWMDSVIEFNRIAEKDVPAFRKIVGNIAVEKFAVLKEAGGRIVGCGYGAVDGGYVGVYDIVVKEAERGKGYGREIVEAILSEAYRRGVRKSYLQVMLNNAVAWKLYEKLGYREIYQYWYRKKEG